MANRKGFFANLMDSRSRQAQAYINSALLMLDDKTLKEYGYDRKELSRQPSSRYPL